MSDTQHKYYCSKCNEILSTTEHDKDGESNRSLTVCQFACSTCGFKKTFVAHNFETYSYTGKDGSTKQYKFCLNCGFETNDCEHEWDHDEYSEEGGNHIRTCKICGYEDKHAIDSEGSYLIIGKKNTCRVPCCRVCKQGVSTTSLEEMENCCHHIACEHNGGLNTHRMYCDRCNYVFSENAPCFQNVEWESLYSNVPMDDNVMAEIASKLLHVHKDGTATLTCACGNTAHVDRSGKYVDGPKKGQNANLLPGGYWVNFDDHTAQRTDYGEDYASLTAAISEFVKAEVGKENLELLKGILGGSWGNGMVTEEQVKEAASKEGITDTEDVSGATVETAGVVAKVVLEDYSEKTDTDGNKTQTAKYDIALGYKLKVTLGEKSFYMDGNYNINVNQPTIISVQAPDNFGSKGDAVRIDHEHGGKTYTYYGKIGEYDNNGVKVKTVSWMSENGLSPFTLTISAAATEEYKKHLNAKFSILDPVVTPPEAKTGLVYNGKAQELIKAGSVEGGTMLYNVDSGEYSTAIPTGTEAKDYTVSYMVKGSTGYSSTNPVTLPVITIAASSSDNPADPNPDNNNGGNDNPGGNNYLLAPGIDINADTKAAVNAKNAIMAFFGDVEIFTLTADNANIGSSRSPADLPPEQLNEVSNDRSIIVAVLPEITVNKTAVFIIGVDCDKNLEGTLEWHSFQKNAENAIADAESANSSECIFLNDDGEKTEHVTENGHVNEAVKLTANKTVAPVITSVTEAVTENGDMIVVSSKGGGCGGLRGTVGGFVFIALALISVIKGIITTSKQ